MRLNNNQNAIYRLILHFLSNQPIGYQFCLDRQFYNSINYTGPISATDKRIIGRYFRQQVQNNAIQNVQFNYVFSNCPRCGYKSTSNKIHYITV